MENPTASASSSSIELPKFSTPFSREPYSGEGFPMAMTLRELAMIKLSGSIRRKPKWWELMKNSDLTATWKKKALKKGYTMNQVSFVFGELDHYASLRDPERGIEVSDVDGVWHSDVLIPDSLRRELLNGVKLLENLPEAKRGLNRNKQIWCLVHPSLYPITYGQTRGRDGEIIQADDRGKIVKEQLADGTPILVVDGNRGFSKTFCWLPTDFYVKEDGTVSIQSYINNLHPIHQKPLYRTLEKMFAKFVPLFERVLGDLAQVPKPNRIKVDSIEWEGQEDHEDDDWQKHQEWVEVREVIQPDAPANFTPRIGPANQINLRGRNLQVMVKLANLQLTPRNPSYPGAVWHVEGMRNENIVASGIYYYDVRNISGSELQFRQEVADLETEGGDEGYEDVYGLSEFHPLNQVLGSVLTSEGRCLAFPNIYQHSVGAFELKNPSIRGHRKILVFFLVDPGTKILSTSDVPPQQLNWYLDDLSRVCLPNGNALPPEIVMHIGKFLDGKISLDKAEELREKLISERKEVNWEERVSYDFYYHDDG